jgi:very-short-patch-repair endonuclease
VAVPRIVRGQSVDPVKAELAKGMRRVMTPEEQLLWDRLRRSQLNGFHFRRQQVIHGFIADFYCHSAALIVELDGNSHEGRQEYDADRDRILTGHGFLTIRFENRAVRDHIDDVLHVIVEYCAQRTRELGT